jgi:class 3 adenylate cyclase
LEKCCDGLSENLDRNLLIRKVNLAIPLDTLRINELENGIVIIDICDSTEMISADIDLICSYLRGLILKEDSNEIVLLKNMGDGFLAVFQTHQPLIKLAERTLSYQARKNKPVEFDLRVTLDAGRTVDTSTASDRLGTAINRAARLEKTQQSDLVVKGAKAGRFLRKNRCLVSSNLRRLLNEEEKRHCLYIGKAKYKGFGDSLHSIYQYNP